LRDRDVLELRQSLAEVRVWRLQDPVADASVALLLKQRRNRVSKVCESKGDERMQRREIEAHSNRRRDRNPVAAWRFCDWAA
jgi:hypothetical protein